MGSDERAWRGDGAGSTLLTAMVLPNQVQAQTWAPYLGIGAGYGNHAWIADSSTILGTRYFTRAHVAQSVQVRTTLSRIYIGTQSQIDVLRWQIINVTPWSTADPSPTVTHSLNTARPASSTYLYTTVEVEFVGGNITEYEGWYPIP